MSSVAPATYEIDNQQDCPLFLLCGELRNKIYELAFTDKREGETVLTALHTAETVDISQAVELAPSGELLTTCQRFYNEAFGIFCAAREQYWSTHSFVVPMSHDFYIEGNEDGEQVNLGALGLHDKHFLHIQEVIFTVSSATFLHEFRFGPNANLFAGLALVQDRLWWDEAPHFRPLEAAREKMALGGVIVEVALGRPRATMDVCRVGSYVAKTKKHLGFAARGRELNINEEGLKAKCETVAKEFTAKAEVESALLKRALLTAIVKHFGVRHKVGIL